MKKYKHIKSIYIGNILEAYHKSYTSDKMPEAEGGFWRKYDALDNNRSLLYGGDNKIVITPEEINHQHLEYICSLAGWKNVHNLVPKRKSDCISLDITGDAGFYAGLRQILKENPGAEIIQYSLTPEFYLLTDKLKADGVSPVLPETVDKEDKFVEEYFHSKRGFRHLWEQTVKNGLKIQIPEGYITGDKKEAIEAAWWFRQKERNFVFKYNRGVQGVGLVFNEAAIMPRQKSEFVRNMSEVLKDGMWNESCIVVEEMIDVDRNILGGSPNVEMRIDKNGRVHREYSCAQVIARDGKTFLGVTMNPEVTGHLHIREAFAAAESYGRRLADLGLRGVFDMDLVVSTENRLYAVEANLRRTGGTHAHEFCKTILGADYTGKYYVHLQDVSVGNHTKEELDMLLEKYKYNPASKTGVIPVNPDMLPMGKLPLLLIAPDGKTLTEILGKINSGINTA